MVDPHPVRSRDAPHLVPPEVEASYTVIIDDILAHSDLNTVSAKRIRKGLQARVDHDITPEKVSLHLFVHCTVLTRFASRMPSPT